MLKIYDLKLCKNFHLSCISLKVISGYDIKPDDISENEFKRYTKSTEERKKRRSIQKKFSMMPPRHTRMPIDQDWPSVWPTASSFKASVVPLPLRQGNVSSKRVIPSSLGNLELMKIPNFLHLTPQAIKQQCEAIKKFCTPWPKALSSQYKFKGLIPFYNTGDDKKSGVYNLSFVETSKLMPPGIENPFAKNNIQECVKSDQTNKHLDSHKNLTKAEFEKIYQTEANKLDKIMSEHFPIEITTSDYCFSAPSLKDPRARKISMKVSVESLRLNYHGTDKLLRLVKNMYDSEKGVFNLITDRCPTRKQNLEYAYYLLTALYHESKLTHPDVRTPNASYPSFIHSLPSEREITKEDICSNSEVREFGNTVSRYHDSPTETEQNIKAYKNSVIRLLGISKFG
ncbi:small ribosomal subunit protein mS35-like isoform X2 [Gordionus sp. m RMFG-2023]|uniref:small ribosomal subunit protein mS35-like isoform X2 n=1 Tax=Gordionus sp. m RMFG-2023 TaxID=3053472 RepID=UPI0031FC32CD